MPDWDKIVVLTRDLGVELDNLQAQMDKTRSVYDTLWDEVKKGQEISTSDQLVQALKTPGNYKLMKGQYTGNFRAVADGVTIIGAELPEDRVGPGQTKDYTLQPSDPLNPTLRIDSSRVALKGMYIAPCKDDRPVLQIGSPSVTTPTAQPDTVSLECMEIEASLTLGGKRGIECHSRAFSLMHSRVIGFWRIGQDSQAFYSANGPGPYTLFNNELQGSGENILFGGGNTQAIEMIPSNIKILSNLIYKPMDWHSKLGATKNSIEFKCAKGAIVEENLIDGCWKDAQSGHMIVLTPRNQTGTNPWNCVEDIVIRNNRSINHLNGYAVNMMYTDNEQKSDTLKRVTIGGNLFQDSPSGIMIQKGVGDFLKITDSTFPKITGAFLYFSGALLTFNKFPLEFARNVAYSGAYGVTGDNTSPGVDTLNKFLGLGTYSFLGNVIEKSKDRPIPYPPGNTILDVGKLAPLLDADFHYIPGGAGW